MTPAAGEMFGVEPVEANGWPLSRFIHGFSLDRVDPRIPGQAATSAPEHWIGRRPDGRPLIVSLQLGLMPASADAFASVSLIDVTETHAANERLRDLDAQLNRIWRLNSLGEMAATLAHELNQPLSAAATYMQASQRDIEKTGLLGQSAGRTLEMAKAQMLRAGAIIRRMRDLLATGTQALNSERVSSMIEDLAPGLAMIGRDRGVEIRTEIEERDDQVRAERIQFQQALINLVRNAVEAVQDRPAPIVLVTGRPVADDLYRITVEDSGPGIPPDQIEHIFRPMTTTKSAGMGLGLSVTRTIVESHGGSLEVGDSRLGGAAFQFDIPRELEDT
jgi:two-component system sensor kinase FixL